jgi:glycerol 3-phosphatase-2
LDALRALCAAHWAAGSELPRVRADGPDAAAALRTLGVVEASATVSAADTATGAHR